MDVYCVWASELCESVFEWCTRRSILCLVCLCNEWDTHGLRADERAPFFPLLPMERHIFASRGDFHMAFCMPLALTFFSLFFPPDDDDDWGLFFSVLFFSHLLHLLRLSVTLIQMPYRPFLKWHGLCVRWNGLCGVESSSMWLSIWIMVRWCWWCFICAPHSTVRLWFQVKF